MVDMKDGTVKFEVEEVKQCSYCWGKHRSKECPYYYQELWGDGGFEAIARAVDIKLWDLARKISNRLTNDEKARILEELGVKKKV